MAATSHLRLIRGEQCEDARIGGVFVCAAHIHDPPFDVDAVVHQEDTFQVLSAPRRILLPTVHPIRIFEDATDVEPEVPGTLAVRETDPLRIHAIVCDLGAEEMCCEEWVEAALSRLWMVARERRLGSVALELLGAFHNHLSYQRASEILWRVLEQEKPDHPIRIWLVVPDELDPARVFDTIRG